MIEEHQSEDEKKAYEQGYSAFNPLVFNDAGEALAYNPYDEDEEEDLWWAFEDGVMDAQDDHEDGHKVLN